jgi:hypothetical protein
MLNGLAQQNMISFPVAKYSCPISDRGYRPPLLNTQIASIGVDLAGPEGSPRGSLSPFSGMPIASFSVDLVEVAGYLHRESLFPHL